MSEIEWDLEPESKMIIRFRCETEHNWFHRGEGTVKFQNTASMFKSQGAPAPYQLALVTLTASTSPRSVTSPVIAVSERTQRPVNRDTRTDTMVTPADGPSFMTAPAGKWMWMSVFSNRSLWGVSMSSCTRKTEGYNYIMCVIVNQFSRNWVTAISVMTAISVTWSPSN